MRITRLALPALGAAAAVLLIAPETSVLGFSTIGGSLSVGQRDFRVFNNFADPQANDNTIPHPQFPGHDGAVRAIWKGFVEWGSELHGDGGGDPTQPFDLGSGGANFDTTFQGDAAGVGGPGDNVASAIASCAGGVAAFFETGAGGYRLRFCDNLVWSDGPGLPGAGELDLQAVASHQFGHLLGLGHTSVAGSVMSPLGGARDLSADDQAGVQFIYGVKSPVKPSITGVSVDPVTNTVTLTGTNFSATNNQVWFTNQQATDPAADPIVKVSGVVSTGAGTQIFVGVPPDAGPGDVLVKSNMSGHASLSNAFPIDVSGTTPTPDITSIVPAVVDSLVPGSAQTISILGTGFTPATTVEVNGVPLTGIPPPFTFISSGQIVFDMPQVNSLGPATIIVRNGPASADSDTITVAPPATPKLQLGNGDPANLIVQASGLDILFGGVPGHALYVVYSTSNVPSVFPGVVALDLGNNFSDIPLVGVFVIEPKGWTSTQVPLSGIAPLSTFFSQGVDLNVFLPFPATNLQEILVL